MIPFNKPYYSGNEAALIRKVMRTRQLTGDLEIIRACEERLEKRYGFKKVFLTNSCTMALEISAVLIDIRPGDEVIMPSYTYVSTANAFAARGARIIFVDSNPDGPNMDAKSVEKLINPKTKAIVAMHYAGVACDMNLLRSLAEKNKLALIEDAAQCIDSFYNKEALGSIGQLGCFSFHETKNIHSGEGGFLVVNDPKLIERAEIIRSKGTNRSAFLRGDVNKYEWVDIGFSAAPSAISAAFLMAQLDKIDEVQRKRIRLWKAYQKELAPLTKKGVLLPSLPSYASNNAHIFHLVCKTGSERNELISFLKQKEINAVFHYQSLHNSPFYTQKHDGRVLPNSDRYSNCLVRLPLYYDLSSSDVEFVCENILSFYKNHSSE